MHFQEGNDGNLQGERGEGAMQWVRRQERVCALHTLGTAVCCAHVE